MGLTEREKDNAKWLPVRHPTSLLFAQVGGLVREVPAEKSLFLFLFFLFSFDFESHSRGCDAYVSQAGPVTKKTAMMFFGVSAVVA